MKRTQSGSALWFILMAIALLAALTIAITRTSNTAEQNGGVEHNRITASDVMRYSAGLEAAIDRMRLHGVSESDIDFDDPALTGYANAGCTTDECKLFTVGGGAMTYSLPAGANDGSAWIFTGALAIAGSGETATPDLIMILPKIDPALCQQINTAMGVTDIPTVTADVTALPKFTGAYDSSPILATTLAQHAGCFADTNGVSAFYQVLIAR